MSRRSSLSWFLASSLLVVACGDGSDPASPSDTGSDPRETASTGHDAGSKDAGVRGTTRDASSRVVDSGTDPTTGDPTTGEPPVIDAGHRDAGAGKGDAGSSNPGTPDAGGTGSVCDTLTYDSFGQPFLSKYCVSCHGAFLPQKNIKLDSLSGVQANTSKVKSEVASKSMPPGGSAAPTAAERQQFGQWIDCGPK
ncbi:MAG: hypothetical protein JWN48_5659 [Myxococcaceae bacterium]|nr:hypothetical protein [Myxococcaceae bacterium]